MKSSLLKTGINSFLFLVMLFSAFMLIRPVYARLYDELDAYRLSALEKLEQTAGIGLSYQSISPSILSAFRIKSILIFDSDTQKTLFQIDNALFFYDIWQLVNGDTEHAFKRLVISGVSIDLGDSEKNAKLLEFIERFKKTENTPVLSPPPSTTSFSLPFDVTVKSVTVRYSDENFTGKANIKSLSYISSLGVVDEAKLQGTLEASLTEAGKKKLPEQARESVSEVSCAFSVSGFLLPGINGSFANIAINSIRTQDIRIEKLSFLAEYTGDFIRVSSLQTGFPFFATAELFTPGEPFAVDSVRVRLQAQNLDPFSVVNVTGNYPALRQIAGATLSGLYSLVWSHSNSTVNYSANGSVRIPNRLVPSPLKKAKGSNGSDMITSYILNGTPELLTITRLDITSEQAEVSYEGNLNLKTYQPDGILAVKRFTLGNGNKISADAYFDVLPTGFVCNIPELFLGDKTFSALQTTIIPGNKSVNFSFEAYDYSHSDFEMPASISVSGNFAFANKYFLQTHISVENLFLDSVVSTASFFLQPETAARLEGISQSLSPYMLTNETSFSTDFSSITYNSPSTSVVNTQKASEFATFAFAGNEKTVSLSDFDVLYGNQSLQASIRFDFSPGFSDISFTSDVAFNTVPYNFSGTIIPGDTITVTGSHDFIATLLFPQAAGENLTGFLQMEEFPVAFDKYVFALSTDISLIGNQIDEPVITFDQIEITEITGVFENEPQLLLAGSANQRSIRFDTISFTDIFSSILGSGEVKWDALGNIVNSASITAELAGPASSEKYEIDFSMENLGKNPFSVKTIQDDYYFTGAAFVTSLPTSRVMRNQRASNAISASLSAQGTIRSPYITVVVTEASFGAGEAPVTASGIVSLSDKLLRVSQAGITAGENTLSDFELDFSLSTFEGTAGAYIDLNLGEESISAPLRMKLTNDENRAYGNAGESAFFQIRIPEAYTLAIASEGFTSTLFDKPKPLEMRISRTAGRFDVFTVNTDAVNGWLLDSGLVLLNIGEGSPVRFNLTGTVAKDALELDINDMTIDVAPFANLLSFSYISVFDAFLSGNMHIGGTFQNPDFSGELAGTNIVLNCPDYVTEHLTAAAASFVIDTNRLSAEAIPFKSKSGGILLDLELFMDGWKFEQLALAIKTPPNSFQAADITLASIQITADAVCDYLNILVSPDDVSVTGSLTTQNGLFEAVLTQSDDAMPARKSSKPVIVDITAKVGNRLQMQVSAPGIAGVSGLVTLGTTVRFQSDTSVNSVSILGDILLRGGEIEYLNRTFYLREGRVLFDGKGETIDPLITLRAEIRENDSITGEQVRITMSAANQRLSAFSAAFSSSPPRSESEIMMLLGQIFLGNLVGNTTDDAGQVAITAVSTIAGSVAQNTILKKMENGLRNLLKLDILSIRTLAFQNIMENSINNQLLASEQRKPLAAGNIFDNTTVYIGKYFGSSLYFDALVHFSYDESKEIIRPESSGIVWRPEIGLEFSSPFATFPTIRMSIAPDLGNDELSFAPALVSSTSITLSWKFSF